MMMISSSQRSTGRKLRSKHKVNQTKIKMDTLIVMMIQANSRLLEKEVRLVFKHLVE